MKKAEFTFARIDAEVKARHKARVKKQQIRQARKDKEHINKLYMLLNSKVA